MKILHIARLYSPHGGGVEKHLEKINTIFVESGHGVTVLTRQFETALPLVEVIDGVEVLRIPNSDSQSEAAHNGFWKKLHFKIQTWMGIWKYLPTLLRADVIQVHDVFWWILPFYPLIWKKVFITLHGYEGENLPNLRQIFWHRLGANLAKGCICVGGFHKKWYGIHPDITTFGGVDFPEGRKSATKKKNFLFLGRVDPDNGIFLYLNAMKMAKETGQEYSLDVFGDGSQRLDAEKYVKKHELDVVFHGFVPNVSSVLANYDAVFVSRYLGILEAMIARKKIVAQYSSPLTKDYLELTPFRDWIELVTTPKEIYEFIYKKNKKNAYKSDNIDKAYRWSKQQTWHKLAQDYVTLWKTK